MSDAVTAPVTLSVGEKSLDLPVMGATQGNDGIVVSSLLKETGLVTMCCGGGLGTGTLIQRV